MYIKQTATILFTLLLSACQSTKIYDNRDYVKIGNASWVISSTTALNQHNIASNESKVVFIRPATNFTDQSSANIALNGRYLVSLQASHFTESLLCSGEAVISVVPTGAKSNSLIASPLTVKLEPQHTYFYLVDIDSTTQQPIITALTADQAVPLLANKSLQTHQISRIVNNCMTKEPTTALPMIKPSINTNEIPVLRLNIRFDNNQSIIKSQFQSEIAKAAKFLVNYPNVDAIIEGHTDANGNESYNQALAKRRAESVRNALISHYGIDMNRVHAISYGKSRPIADNATAVGRQQNRRVIIVIPSQVK